MTGIVLTTYSGAILGPIAKILGWIMNLIYEGVYNLFGIESVALSILIITVVIYTALLPFTIKQQKFAKLQQKMQPEIQKIQEKYKNKKDQASMQAMQQETTYVYQKYGVSPTGSCVQMLIQFPILLALYRVFYNIPAYITSIKEYYGLTVADKVVEGSIVDVISNTPDFQTKMTEIMTTYKINLQGIDFSAADSVAVNRNIVDVIYKLPKEGLENLTNYFSNIGDAVDQIIPHINHFNYLFGLNISDTPWNIITTSFQAKSFGFLFLALMIPVLSYLTQVINIKLMPTNNTNGKDNQNDQMAQSMKMMNTMMPLMSLFFCFTVPVGLGIYWILSAVVRGIQQVAVNKHIENLNLDDIIAKNEEKAKAKREKMGIYESQIRNAANTNTRSISSKANANSNNSGYDSVTMGNVKPGSMASKANKVREFNEKNSKNS